MKSMLSVVVVLEFLYCCCSHMYDVGKGDGKIVQFFTIPIDNCTFDVTWYFGRALSS